MTGDASAQAHGERRLAAPRAAEQERQAAQGGRARRRARPRRRSMMRDARAVVPRDELARSSTSRGAPDATTRPSSRSASRSAYCAASVSSCMAATTVRPASRRSSSTSSSTSWLAADVERRGRLVEEQHRRLLRERAREHGALPLAAAQRAEPPAARARGGRAGRARAPRPRGRCGPRAAKVAEVRRAPEQDVLGDEHLRRQRRRLRHEGDRAGRAPCAPCGRRLDAVERDRARRGTSRERAQQRALAGSVRADQRQPLALVDRQPETSRGSAAVERDRHARRTRPPSRQPPGSCAGRSRRTARRRTR